MTIPSTAPADRAKGRAGAAEGVVAPALLDLNSPKTKRVCLTIIVIIITLGAIARIKQYAARASYWNDEAAVVVNVMQRDWRQLTDRLDYAQAAPPLFLWIERGMYRCFGAGEYSLRLPPLILSLLTLPLFARLAWRMLPPTSACWAVAWFTFFARTVHHGCDVKQYSGDLLGTVCLMLIVYGGFTENAMRRMIGLSIAAAVGLWLSFPIIFVYGALAAVLLPACLRARARGVLAWCAGGAIVAVSLAGLCQLPSLRNVDPALTGFWLESFPDLHRPAHLVIWLSRQLFSLFGYPFESFSAFSAALAILGIIALARLRKYRVLAVLTGALVLAFIAAALHRYPFPGGNRLGLYLIPITILILAAGAEGQNIGAPAVLCRWWWILPAPLLLLELGQVAKDFATRQEDSTTRPLVAYVKSHRLLDEPIYLFGDSLTALRPSGRSAEFLCYWPDAPGKIVVGYVDPTAIQARRFWLIYSLGHPEANPGTFAKQLLHEFPNQVHVIDSYQVRKQAGAVLVAQ